MENIKFRGTGVAIVTPFNTDFSVDYHSLEALVKDMHQGQVEFLVILGTTGESVTLSKEEKADIIQFVIDKNKGKLPLVLGIGGNNTAEMVHQIQECPEGIDAILSVSPFYNKPSQEGIYQHFSALAKVAPKPIILYNVPGRTSSNMEPETVLRLANDFGNIIAVKEAKGDLNQAMKLIENKPKDFLVLSGDDAITCAMTLMGGDGVISVQAMGAPKVFSDMVRFALEGKKEEALKNHYIQNTMMDLIFEEGNPAGIKSALKSRGIITTDEVRLPLIKASKSLEEKINTELKKIANL
ncbi:MAG: 4-hydroxy-tetrahydrodipicolinate synthase [Flavobacteriales bacterium]|jgi:4-hydroxy-tetrahydrodipicolinate synthase|nr:4-hydroxy-tetrahydrodipicolinate synthase [Flavobacteriales bacterium]